ncbi:MAG: YgiQ family radical SAM protein [Victivallales bacterium]|nr:YgiQ family radical SAM protein [Victivallales bacterium]
MPVTREDMARRGWDTLDVLFITGDAYIDHPSFGIPLLGRWLEHHGYRVGIIAQPRWNTTDDITRMGRPRLFCGVSAGALDSMLCHYTAFRKKRHDDAYTPGGLAGARPNRATIVYTNLVRSAFPGLPVTIGGIEASLRKLAHYDFWTDALRRSILFDARADLVQYGMGELSTLEIARRLEQGLPLKGIPGTAWIGNEPGDAELLPSYEAILEDHRKLITATSLAERHFHTGEGRMAQQHGTKYVIVEPPMRPVTAEEMDEIYSLPYLRDQHPSYKQRIPALDMIKWSITAVRGCGGSCSFCSLAQHQGRRITSRSTESILKETTQLTHSPGWKGTISDVGGPTANLWGASCDINGKGCVRDSCLAPVICPHLKLNQTAFLNLLKAVKRVQGVKNVGIASGIRYDAALKDPVFMEGLIHDFVSGHLKIAPEHCDDSVLTLMRKPPFRIFEQFLSAFQKLSAKYGKQQYIIPYIISAFPGCTHKGMKTCADWFHSKHWRPQQVQCFIPTPGTMATAMYYAQCDPKGRPLPVATTDRERLQQHGMLFKD